ncbi:glycosyltransferase family 2 protein [Candidatus Venteria ishoeyi]|uniref:glycosyltransferase family 2 protein n=1 Tax=Candidatus Venteria ishoeyi TaxID=1899563 RepID=UPI0025A4CF7E|nr:glycosyltransferase family 2 protein [Candidatus Venteria ishoeyi]MDM8546802.1 glycosyltransferase family 2 protein [Candidatus Venteria ishoeyi]
MSNQNEGHDQVSATSKAALSETRRQLNQHRRWLLQLQNQTQRLRSGIIWQLGRRLHYWLLRWLPSIDNSNPERELQDLNQQIKQQQNLPASALLMHNIPEVSDYPPWIGAEPYARWCKTQIPDPQKIQDEQALWQESPVLGFVLWVPVKPDLQLLDKTLQSLLRQIVPHWSLYLLTHEAPALPQDSRIQHVKITTTEIQAFNQLLATAQESWLAWLKPGDQLAEDATYQISKHLLARPHIRFLYSDEDCIDEQNQYSNPDFKPDWDMDLFYARDYTANLGVYHRETLLNIGGFSKQYPNCESYELRLHLCTDLTSGQICHIPKVLYHVYQKAQGAGVPTNSAKTNQRSQLLLDYFASRKQVVSIQTIGQDCLRVVYPLPDTLPKVSIIIPTRDNLALLTTTINGLLEHTDYPDLEILIMDNDSQKAETQTYLKNIGQNPQVQVFPMPGAFNYSKLNNHGVEQAQGEIIALLNNDLKIIHPDWLKEMVSQALRPEVGAVGAKLYYADGRLQHAGVILGIRGMAGHVFKGVSALDPAYAFKPFLVQNYSAVTGACLVMRRNVYQQIGGLDEIHLKVAFNDIDLCLRLREAGYHILWTPHAALYHLESASRGIDTRLKQFLRLRAELAYMRKRWGTALNNDPFYNPNLSLNDEFCQLHDPLHKE